MPTYAIAYRLHSPPALMAVALTPAQLNFAARLSNSNAYSHRAVSYLRSDRLPGRFSGEAIDISR
jgi:hypothetical protein